MQHTTKQFLRQSILRRLDGLVSRLTDYQVLKGKPAQIAEHEISNICWLVSEVFLEDPVFIEIRLTPSLYIIGDIYGQYCDLLRIFNVLGHPPNQKYLFLGNLIDRGSRSIETLTLLMAYKLLYPHHIYLLRGKHECEYVSKQYGFYEECTKRFSCRLWRSIVSAFDYMPLMASIEDRIFCSSGGLSPMLEFSGVRTLNDFKNYVAKLVVRPTDIQSNIIASHFLWSAPDHYIDTWEQNPAGMAYNFGASVVANFCDKLGYEQIIRSSEFFEAGYDFFKEPRLLTIFSAPHYMGYFKNDAAIVQVTKASREIKCRIKLIKPLYKMRAKMTGRMNLMIIDSWENKGEISSEL